MKITKQLRGKKAEKFEDLFTAFIKKVEIESGKWENKLSGLESVWYQLGEFTDVADLYQTSFTPSLIELFEGWELGGNVYYFKDKPIEVPPIRVILLEDAIILNDDDLYCEYPKEHFKTLSDFISACNNSGIELIFKEN